MKENLQRPHKQSKLSLLTWESMEADPILGSFHVSASKGLQPAISSFHEKKNTPEKNTLLNRKDAKFWVPTGICFSK